jgi:hypothetical protein
VTFGGRHQPTWPIRCAAGLSLVGLIAGFGCASDGAPEPAPIQSEAVDDSTTGAADSSSKADVDDESTAQPTAESPDEEARRQRAEAFAKHTPWLDRRVERQKKREEQQAKMRIEQIEPSPEVADVFVEWVEVLEVSEDPAQRALAARSLVALDSKASIYYLVGALEDPEPMVVVHVIHALRATQHPSVIFPIFNQRSHPDPRVRQAVEGVIRAGDPAGKAP